MSAVIKYVYLWYDWNKDLSSGSSKSVRKGESKRFALDGMLLSVDVPCANQTERSELHKGMIRSKKES